MFGRRTSRADRLRHDARSVAKRGLERGRHRAEALRDAIPEGGQLISELRDQAEPVLKAAREQAEKTPLTQKKKSRSKKPFLLLALAVVGAVIAYVVLSRRGHEPAYLMEEPDEPDTSPVESPPSSDTGGNGWTPGGMPDVEPSVPNGESVPERASAYMAGQPAQPTQASSAAGATSEDGAGSESASGSADEQQGSSPQSASGQTDTAPDSETTSATSSPAGTPAGQSPSSSASTSAPSFGYQPRAQVAAWDLPPSSIPPMRGNSL